MDRNRLVEQLKRHEGYRAKPYQDTEGKLTIGYGRNLEDTGIRPDEWVYLFETSVGMLPHHATRLLVNDINDATETAQMFFRGFDNLSPLRQEVLVNMAFNLGRRLRQFSKLLMALARDDYTRAAKEMLDSKWARQVGQRATELAYQMEHDEVWNE